VIHRNLAEATARASRLCADGFDATPYMSFGTRGFRFIRAAPPDAILIDLTQLPSYGKAMGVVLRENKLLRAIPLVFLEGDPEKAALVRAVLPDAVFAPWVRVAAAIHRAIRRATAEPMAPVSPRRPLLTKLGISDGKRVALLHAPKGFQLPEGSWKRGTRDNADVILAFYTSPASLGRDLPALAGTMRKGVRFWLVWPKRSGAASSDLSLPRIAEMVVLYGLTGYKICAVDEKWSGIAIGRRTRAK
jgi:hypothetical protein